MQTPNGESVKLTQANLERIAVALGTALHTPYAPPHVYPMSAPAFTSNPQIERQREPGPHGLYIHVPFCNYSCSFCFYARRIGDGLPEMERYVRGLRRELEWAEPGTPLTQLYVGGGTPTALPAELLDAVLGDVFTRMKPEGKLIHTVECSPESVSDGHLKSFARHGVGRVSMGIQSLNQEVLDIVNRDHGSGQALEACDRLVASGLMVNVDLIYGLPGQSEAVFRSDFETLAARGIHSITAYNLRINERTAVVQDMAPTDQLDLARLVRWRAFVQQTAAAAGFVQKTWHRFERNTPEAARYEDKTGAGNQLGIGQSARSRFGSTIYCNHASVAVYLERVENGRSAVEETFHLGEEDRRIRFVGHSLGVGKPIVREAYRQTFGHAFDDDFSEPLERMKRADLVEDAGDAVHLTPTGRLFYDLVTLAFYPQRIKDWLEERHAIAMRKGQSRATNPGTVVPGLS
ncbi:MAG: coproporphyrinogen III oxidase family protein [Planctomycetes bacterium]|nr:coproporphyrinogen III oxidase family protein [Planctomycetota bacterium]